jgi:hypothetical protein
MKARLWRRQGHQQQCQSRNPRRFTFRRRRLGKCVMPRRHWVLPPKPVKGGNRGGKPWLDAEIWGSKGLLVSNMVDQEQAATCQRA